MDKEIREFLDYLNLSGKKLKTIESYRLYLKRFSKFCNNRPISEIKLNDIAAFHNDLLANYSPSTASYHIASIKSFLNFLAKMEKNSLNPSVLNIPRYQRKEAKFLTKTEVHKLLTSASPASELRDRVILEILATSGARLQELLNIKLRHIDFESRSIVIVNGKGDKTRLTFLTKEASELVKRYAIMNSLGPDSLLFSITPRSVQRLLTKYCEKAGIKKVSPHALRHSLATSLLQRGSNIKQVQVLLGHKSILTTQIYTHITDKELQKAYNLAQSSFATAPDGTITTNEFTIMSKENYYSLMGKLNKLLQFQKQILDILG